MKKSKLPILRCINYDNGEVIESRCSRKRMRKMASLYAGRKTKYKNIKIFAVHNWAYEESKLNGGNKQ